MSKLVSFCISQHVDHFKRKYECESISIMLHAASKTKVIDLTIKHSSDLSYESKAVRLEGVKLYIMPRINLPIVCRAIQFLKGKEEEEEEQN